MAFCFCLDCTEWVFEFLDLLSCTGRVVTKICGDVTQILSSNIAYLLACRKKSSIDSGGFFWS